MVTQVAEVVTPVAEVVTPVAEVVKPVAEVAARMLAVVTNGDDVTVPDLTGDSTPRA